MLSRQQLSRTAASIVALSLVMFCAIPRNVAAQDQEHSSFLANLAKGVALDPTTYVPAVVAYDSTIRDWNSSQPFFQHGYLEHNARYTISGLADDVPVGFGEGRHRILMDGFANLQMSLINNAASRVIERALTERYPTHRKLVRTLGWIERTAFASYMTYALSSAHYQQWRLNVQLSHQWSPN